MSRLVFAREMGRGKAARPVTVERRSPWVAIYAVFLTAGWPPGTPRTAAFRSPGERPRGFGASAGVPRVGRSVQKLLKTLVGVSFRGGNCLSQGSLRSATTPLARRSWA